LKLKHVWQPSLKHVWQP